MGFPHPGGRLSTLPEVTNTIPHVSASVTQKTPDEHLPEQPVATTVASPRRPGRLAMLDGLRFVAAGSVLLFHFTARSNDSWGVKPWQVFPRASHLTAFGCFGVDLFFIISGFVIFMTAWGRTLPAFVGSRVGRLFPAYWTGVALTGFLLMVLWPGRKPISLADIGINLTMMAKPLGYTNVDGVYWTLWAELRFYVLIGLLLWAGLTKGRAVAFAALWPLAGALAERSGSDWLATVLVSSYAPLFAGGMMLFLIYQERRNLIAWAVLAENVLFSATFAGAHTGDSVNNDTPYHASDNEIGLAVLLCYAAVMLVTLTPLARPQWRWLTTLGALTYPLYLVHEYWGWWFIKLWHDDLPPYVMLAVAAALCIGIALLVQRLVERRYAKPLTTAVRRSLERLA